jgi:hypothetical protein
VVGWNTNLAQSTLKMIVRGSNGKGNKLSDIPHFPEYSLMLTSSKYLSEV